MLVNVVCCVLLQDKVSWKSVGHALKQATRPVYANVPIVVFGWWLMLLYHGLNTLGSDHVMTQLRH